MTRVRLGAALASFWISTAGVLAAVTPPAPAGSILVPGAPTGVAVLDGGARVVVGYEGRFAIAGGFALFRRSAAGYVLVNSVRTESAVEGVAVGPDGRTAVATTRYGLAAVDLAALEAGTAKARSLRIGAAPDANQIVFAHDGAHVFFTVQRYAELGVASVAPGDAVNPPTLDVVAHVPLDRSPGGIALSPDGELLYVTSETDAVDGKATPGFGDPRLGREKCASNLGPSGVLSVIAADKAVADPAHAVSAKIAAGCAPTRVALSPDGNTAWVTVRGENRVVAFDTAKVRDDPAHALLASLAVGDVPVGLALSLDGNTVLVANSHRSRDADDAREATLSVIDTAAALAGKPAVVASLPTGALAREVVAAPSGGFFVTDYLSKAVAVVAKASLRPAAPASR